MEGLIGSLCKKAVSGPTRSHFLCRPASILTDQTYLIRVWCALSHFITLYKESTVGFSSFSRWPFWRCSRGSRHIPFLSTGCTGSQQSAQWAAVRDKNPATEREQGIAVLSLLARICSLREELTLNLWNTEAVKKVIVAGWEISIEFSSLFPTKRNIQICAVSAPPGERELAETHLSCVEAARGFTGGIEC